jgi:hypothetical protein
MAPKFWFKGTLDKSNWAYNSVEISLLGLNIEMFYFIFQKWCYVIQNEKLYQTVMGHQLGGGELTQL